MNESLEIPHSDTPDSTPSDTPDSTPSNTPESTPSDTPDSTPSNTPESTPSDTPESSKQPPEPQDPLSQTAADLDVPFVLHKNPNPPNLQPQTAPLKAKLVSNDSQASSAAQALDDSFLTTRLIQFTTLLFSAVVFFVYVDLERFEWISLLTEQVFQGSARSAFGLQPESLKEPILGLRLFSHQFIATGFLSLILTAMILHKAGKFVESYGSQTTLIVAYTLSGLCGHILMVGWELVLDDSFNYGFGTWPSLMGVVAAQYAIQWRAASHKKQLTVTTGLFSLMFRFWLFSWLYFAGLALSQEYLIYAFSLFAIAATVGYSCGLILPAKAVKPQSPSPCSSSPHSWTVFAVLLLVFLSFALGLFDSRVHSALAPRSAPIISKAGAFLRPHLDRANWKQLDLDKVKATLTTPNNWAVLRETQNFALLGPQRFGFSTARVALLVSPRNPYDSPDAAMGRFLTLMFEEFQLSEGDYALIEERPFKHGLGRALATTFYVETGSRHLPVGYKFAYYIVSEDMSIAFLTLDDFADDQEQIVRAVVGSFHFQPQR